MKKLLIFLSTGEKSFRNSSIFLSIIFSVLFARPLFGQIQTENVEQSTVEVEKATPQPIQKSNIELPKFEERSGKETPVNSKKAVLEETPVNSKKAVIEKATGKEELIILSQENLEKVQALKQIKAQKSIDAISEDSNSKNEKMNSNENSNLTESEN